MPGIWCSAGPAPVAIEAAQTGVTLGNAGTQSSTKCPRSISSCSVGARPPATARSSIAGFIASMTARTSFLLIGSPQPGESPSGRLLPAKQARRAQFRQSPQDPQARVLLALAAAAAEQHPPERRDEQHGKRREEDREPGADERRRLREERQRAGGLVVEARAHATQERTRREIAERG